MVIADNAGYYVDFIFENSDNLDGAALLFGAVLFSFQIYGDFSGYSDMAIGIARLFGFQLMQNFAFPYFSRDIAEFWRRWHISLSSWFKDYVYIPLGGSRVSSILRIRNIFIIFLLSGFWHGANWTFIVWGLFNALYFLPLMLFSLNRSNISFDNQGLLPSIKDSSLIFVTFSLVTLSWVFFRADNINHAFTYLSSMFSGTIFNISSLTSLKVESLVGSALTKRYLVVLIVLFVVVEWINRHEQHGLALMKNISFRIIRYLIYFILIYMIINFGIDNQQFIYFQF